MNKKFNGFTLAETLMTLVIIGVIAAITIPNLKKQADAQQTIAGLKKAYSTLSNVINMSENENSYLKSWNFNLSSEDFYKTYLKDYFNVISECSSQSTACFGDGIKYANGQDFSDTSAYFFILADGSRVILLNQKAHAHFLYDINGNKKPNTVGMDVFVFTLTPRAFSEEGTHNVPEPGLYPYGAGLSRNKMLTQCKGQGDACTGLIISDNYQIKSDFPW